MRPWFASQARMREARERVCLLRSCRRVRSIPLLDWRGVGSRASGFIHAESIGQNSSAGYPATGTPPGVLYGTALRTGGGSA